MLYRTVNQNFLSLNHVVNKLSDYFLFQKFLKILWELLSSNEESIVFYVSSVILPTPYMSHPMPQIAEHLKWQNLISVLQATDQHI